MLKPPQLNKVHGMTHKNDLISIFPGNVSKLFKFHIPTHLHLHLLLLHIVIQIVAPLWLNQFSYSTGVMYDDKGSF